MKEKILILGSESLGRGDDGLGGGLLANFLRILGEKEEKPQKIICWNTGVRLVTNGSHVLVHLKRLEEQGVEILSCQTCVDYFDLEDKVAVGKISNMSVFVDLLLNSDVISV